jgi:hypothetical protein
MVPSCFPDVALAVETKHSHDLKAIADSFVYTLCMQGHDSTQEWSCECSLSSYLCQQAT